MSCSSSSHRRQYPSGLASVQPLTANVAFGGSLESIGVTIKLSKGPLFGSPSLLSSHALISLALQYKEDNYAA